MPYEIFHPFERYQWGHPYHNFSQFLTTGRDLVELYPGSSFRYEFNAATQLHSITVNVPYVPRLPIPQFGTGRLNALPPPQPFYYYNKALGLNYFTPPPVSVLASPFAAPAPSFGNIGYANTSVAQTWNSTVACPGPGYMSQYPPMQPYSMPPQSMPQYPQQYVTPSLVQPPPYNALFGPARRISNIPQPFQSSNGATERIVYANHCPNVASNTSAFSSNAQPSAYVGRESLLSAAHDNDFRRIAQTTSGVFSPPAIYDSVPKVAQSGIVVQRTTTELQDETQNIETTRQDSTRTLRARKTVQARSSVITSNHIAIKREKREAEDSDNELGGGLNSIPRVKRRRA